MVPLGVPRHVVLLLALTIALVFSLGRATAQPPAPAATALGTSFTYQGQLQNSGSPANGNFDFQFVLYDAATGGAQVGGSPIITKDAVTVTNGLFNVQLDFGNVFNGAQYYLEVGVRLAGGNTYTTLSPRQALSPTPYALYALKAGQASVAQSVPWSGVTGKPVANVLRKITIPGNALAPSIGTGITTSAWGPNLANNAPALSFVVPQPSDWDKTTPFTVTLYFALPVGPGSTGTVNWRLQAGGAKINAPQSEANSGWDSLDFWTTEDGAPVALPNVTGGYFDLMKSQSWVAKYSSTYNTWYFGTTGSVTTANSFSDNPIWHFAFLRGRVASNGESYTGDLRIVAAELSYTTQR